MLLLTSALYPVVVTQCRQYSIVAALMLHKEHSFIAPIVKVSSSEYVPKVTTRPAFVAWTPPWTSLLSAELEAGPTCTVRRISLAHGSSPNSKANFAICRSRTQILPLVSRVAGPSKIPSATANNERRFCRQTTPDLITTQGSLSDSSRVILSKISQDGSRR
ncbi:hypothetical protein QC763_114790 [Podospora pseudopauciseta]|uniref:Uncharacterized protein n=1 Tax=Podospora pseudopauciseta TaxID=2093780 RepID=A0ABR0I0S3_9PEZI|nr:hypothetical protein QC763_114790 [Podospora pseudopauciseta]